ncbi:hypothetical protein FSP39_004093 [Pinctada imbricata]|uniref:Uncharacterized protein n=1 Tax=Pinctada imbricata TaxID=66713 RepID=A0AA88YCF3_PINIB|nr:hypothetical protein FSP39_004093 [Pinctada imbricata]
MVRLENAELKFPNEGDGERIIFYHQYVVRSTRDISFFELGDSGSLVFARKKQQGGDKGAPLVCFGMAIGKLLDGGCIVTPIHDILESFRLPIDAFVSFPRDSHSGSEDDHDDDEWDDDDGNDPGGGNNKDGKQQHKKSNSFIRNLREKKAEKTKNQQNRSMDFVSGQKQEPRLGNSQMQYSFFAGGCKESADEHTYDAKNGEISRVSSISASTASTQTIATKLTRDASLDNVHTIKRVSRGYDQELSFPGVSAASSLHSDVTLQESVHLSTSLNEQSLQVRPKTYRLPKHERNSTSPSTQSDGTVYLTAPPDFSMVGVHAKQFQSPRNTVGRAGTGAEGIFATMDGSHADRYLPQSKDARGLDANAEHLMASRCSSDMSLQTSPECKNLSQPSIARKNRHDWSDTLHSYENDDLQTMQLVHPQYQNQTAVPLSIPYSIPNNPLYQSYVDSNTPNAYGHTTERKQVCTSEHSVPPVTVNQQVSSAEFNSLLQLLQSTQIKPAAPVPAVTYESDSRKITYHGDKSFSLQDNQFSFHTESTGVVVAEKPENKSGEVKKEESTLAESKYIDQKQNPSNTLNTKTNTFLPLKTLEDDFKIKLTECAFQITCEVLKELFNESLS